MISLDGGRSGSVRLRLFNIRLIFRAWVGCRGRKTKKSSRTGFTWHVRGAELVGRLCSRELLPSPGLSAVLDCDPWGPLCRACSHGMFEPLSSPPPVNVVSGQNSARYVGSIGFVCVQCCLDVLTRRRCQPTLVILWKCHATEPLFLAIV